MYLKEDLLEKAIEDNYIEVESSLIIELFNAIVGYKKNNKGYFTVGMLEKASGLGKYYFADAAEALLELGVIKYQDGKINGFCRPDTVMIVNSPIIGE